MPSGGGGVELTRWLTVGVDEIMEEITTFAVFTWPDHDRQIVVPPGVTVTFKHEMSSPPFYWETKLREGTHTFQLNEGWNKYKVRLESPGSASVTWVL